MQNKGLKNICVTLLCIMLLTSCVSPFGGMRNLSSNDATVMTETLHSVIEAINHKDRSALREMFSETALSEVQDFDESLDYLFSFIDGKIVTYPEKDYPTTSTHYEHGEKVEVAKSWDFFETEQGTKYRYCIVKYLADTENPENVGIYMLQIIDPAKEEEQFDGGNDKLYPGIYVPEE